MSLKINIINPKILLQHYNIIIYNHIDFQLTYNRFPKTYIAYIKIYKRDPNNDVKIMYLKHLNLLILLV